MRWVDALIEDIRPKFGGIPTFILDPDHLLDIPEVREAIRSNGMALGDWDGIPTSLVALKTLDDDAMPILVVGDTAKRHIVEACLINFRWESISVGALMPKFAPFVVKSIPSSKWDKLLELHDEARTPRSPQDTALLIGRALYGVDTEFLRHGQGWLQLLTRLAISGEPLPLPIARAITESSSPPWPEIHRPDTLSETANSRAALSAILDNQPVIYEQASRAEQVLISDLTAEYSAISPEVEICDLVSLWHQEATTPETVLRFGLEYAKVQDQGGLSETTRVEIYDLFSAWLKINYGLLFSTVNPAVLRLSTLLNTLDAEYSGERVVLFVIDSLGLAAWERVKARWISDGVIGGAVTRAAFAILPTITTLSRRAIFEGKPPSQFSPDVHSQRLERTLWANRYNNQGECFHDAEMRGFADSLAKNTPNICVVDISWDKRGHSIDPRTDSIAEAANTWAGRTGVRDMVSAALDAGYRVILTADHGQTECIGQGRLNVGTLTDERSKRVMLFSDKSVCNNAGTDWTDNFRPTGLPVDMFPLFAASLSSFDFKGAATVSHGGLSLDEVLVPVAELTK